MPSSSLFIYHFPYYSKLPEDIVTIRLRHHSMGMSSIIDNGPTLPRVKINRRLIILWRHWSGYRKVLNLSLVVKLHRFSWVVYYKLIYLNNHCYTFKPSLCLMFNQSEPIIEAEDLKKASGNFIICEEKWDRLCTTSPSSGYSSRGSRFLQLLANDMTQLQ